MKYAIARYYIDNFTVYESLDGTLYCLPSDWDCFIPNISEPTTVLSPVWGQQLSHVDSLKNLQKQLERRLPNTSLRVVSAAGQAIYLAADFPFSKIHALSIKEFETLSQETALELLCQNQPRQSACLQPISSTQYPAFLKFLVSFRHFSTEQILTLYAHSPKLTNVKTIGEWMQMGYRIPSEKIDSAIPLDISISQSFFYRQKTKYPVEYAMHSERTAIAIGTLPTKEVTVSSCLLVLDSNGLSNEAFYPPRECNAKLFFDCVSKLAATQGIQIKSDTQYTKPFYQNGTIHMPLESNELQLAKMFCREYAAAVCDKTCIVNDTQIKDLYTDSLAYLLAYQYGLDDDQTLHLSGIWREIGENIDLLALTTYLHNTLLHVNSRISPKLFPALEELQALENNVLRNLSYEPSSNKSKFKNLSGGNE